MEEEGKLGREAGGYHHGHRGLEEAERESRVRGWQRVRMYRGANRRSGGRAGIGIGMLQESRERCFSRATALAPASRSSCR